MGKNDVSNLSIRVSAKDVGVNRTLQRIYKNVASFASVTKTIALGATAAIAAMGAVVATQMSAAAERIDDAGKAAERLGVLPEELTATAYAARMANMQTTEYYSNVEKLTKKISEANSGDKGAIATFEELRLSSRELANSGLQRRLELIASALGGIGDKSDRLRLSMELFGKSGSGMINMLSGGSESLRAMVQEAKDLNQVMTQFDVDIIDKRNDAVDRAKAAIDGAWNKLTIAGAPTLAAAMDSLTEAIKGVDWNSLGNVLAGAVKAASGGVSYLGAAWNAMGNYGQAALLQAEILGKKYWADTEMRISRQVIMGDRDAGYADDWKQRLQQAEATHSAKMLDVDYIRRERDAILSLSPFKQAYEDTVKFNNKVDAIISDANKGKEQESGEARQVGSTLQELRGLEQYSRESQRVAQDWMRKTGSAMAERVRLLQVIKSPSIGESRPGVFSELRRKGSYSEFQARAGVVETAEAARANREKELIEANRKLAEVNGNISALLRDVVVGIRGLAGIGAVGF
jgi:hypothetical protein